ncbi:hypothetical protein BDV06DRAFT_222635 [Aspergillus oleicola]
MPGTGAAAGEETRTGTIIITGSTTPLATAIIDLLLTEYPTYTLILTSRNPARIKVPTQTQTPISDLELGSNTTTETNILTKRLDLSSLTSVHDFATTVATDIQIGLLPPLSGIICAAYHCDSRKRKTTLKKRSMDTRVKMNMSRAHEEKRKDTEDGYGRTFQVNYIAHAALIMRLLGNFRRDGGRVVLFGDEDGFEINGASGYLSGIPDNLDTLVEVDDFGEGEMEFEFELGMESECEWEWEAQHRGEDKKRGRRMKTTAVVKGPKEDCMAREKQQYATSKQATVMWMHALNRHLEEDLALGAITAAAVNVNPGIKSETRALGHLNSNSFSRGLRQSANFSAKSLLSLKVLAQCLTRPFLHLGRQFVSPNIKRPLTIGDAATDIVGLATNTISPFEGGYFDLKDRETLGIVRADVGSSWWNSFDLGEDERREEALWNKTLEWAGVSDRNTGLKVEY